MTLKQNDSAAVTPSPDKVRQEPSGTAVNKVKDGHTRLETSSSGVGKVEIKLTSNESANKKTQGTPQASGQGTPQVGTVPAPPAQVGKLPLPPRPNNNNLQQ